MKGFLFIAVFLTLSFINPNFAQQTPNEKKVEIKGVVKNQDKISLAGLVLLFEGKELKETVISDENGAFAIKLPVGKYKVTANSAVSKNFVAFIETFDNNLNPTDFELIIETDKFCCTQTSNGNVTEVVKYVAPVYPPAARAVRAQGEVVINVKINKEGKVVGLNVESGHPLLRKVSEQAAEQWLFTSDTNETEREGKLVFAFVQGKNETGNTQFLKPNRLTIFAIKPTVDY